MNKRSIISRLQTGLGWALMPALLVATLSSAQAIPPPVDTATRYNQTFLRTEGWTGADGTYSVPLSDGSTLWSFSDTFFGEVVDGRRTDPFRFVNNSLVLEDGEEFHFLKAPVFTPPDREGWFWLFDGVEDAGTEYLLGQFISDGSGAFGFRQTGLWWSRLRVDRDPLRVRVEEYRKLPFFHSDSEALQCFGSALMVDPPWIYVYGFHDSDSDRRALLARTPMGTLGEAGCWRFFDGDSWVRDPNEAKALFSGASVEYSVHKTRSGDYFYVSNDEGGMSRRIVARTAPRPEGPWSEPFLVGEAPEHEGTVFAYNAKAHPEASPPNALLISYNLNTTDLDQVVEEADIYRPRFLLWSPPDTSLLPVREVRTQASERPGLSP